MQTMYASGSAVSDVLWAGVVFLALLVLAGWVFLRIQKRWDPRRQGSSSSDEALTIEQIEALRRAGQISDEEFAVLRRAVLKRRIDLSGKFDPEESQSKSSCSDSKIVDPTLDPYAEEASGEREGA